MAAAEWVFIAVPMLDLSAADAAFELVVGDSGDARPGFAVVTVGRATSGTVRFDRESLAYDDAGSPATWNAAAGLAAALYPSVGADVPASRAADRSVLNAVAAHVARAVGRRGLMELGDHLDAAPAAVIVGCPATTRDAALDTLSGAGPAMLRRVSLEEGRIDRMAQTIRTFVSEAGSSAIRPVESL